MVDRNGRRGAMIESGEVAPSLATKYSSYLVELRAQRTGRSSRSGRRAGPWRPVYVVAEVRGPATGTWRSFVASVAGSSYGPLAGRTAASDASTRQTRSSIASSPHRAFRTRVGPIVETTRVVMAESDQPRDPSSARTACRRRTTEARHHVGEPPAFYGTSTSSPNPQTLTDIDSRTRHPSPDRMSHANSSGRGI